MSPIQVIGKIHELTDVDALSQKITDVINGIDEEAINSFVNKITNVFDIEKLQDEKGELKLLLNQVKDLVE